MNIKRNLKYILSGSVVFLILYMFLAAFPTGPSLYFQPLWTVNAGDSAKASTPENPGSGTVEPFKLGNLFGFFSSQGDLLFTRQSQLKTSVSSGGWAEYQQNSASAEVFAPDGTLRMKVEDSGFPYLDEDRVYLFLPGGDGVRLYGSDGLPLWTREHTAPITAFNSSRSATVIGYADGRLLALKNDGTVILSFYPGGSDYEVILGAAVSDDGTLIACVSGIDRQRFLLIKVTGNHYKVIHHEWLEGNARRQLTVAFERSGEFAFFECAEGLGVVDCEKLEVRIIPLRGTVVSIGKDPGAEPFTVLSQEEDTCVLTAIERPWNVVAVTEFAARDAFLIQKGRTLYLGTDGRVSRIDIRGLE